MIYVFIAHGFEEIEAFAVVDILRRAELSVKTVGVGAKTITGAHGITVHCDMIDHMATSKGLEMVVLPGGMPGTLNLEKSDTVKAFIEHAVKNDLWLGAICAAPSILGHMGLLKGKSFTCFPGYEGEAQEASHKAECVVKDGKLVTGKGPGAAVDFSLALVECLCGADKSAAVRAALQ